MKFYSIFFFFLLVTLFLFSCSKSDNDLEYIDLPDLSERVLAGGATTIFTNSSRAYGFPAENLSAKDLEQHLNGDLVFNSTYVTAPNPVNSGLGPLFNNSSCVSCHPNDGRAPFPTNLNERSGFFLRASLPGISDKGGPIPVPGFNLQIQNHAIFGVEPEGKFAVTYSTITEEFPDGTKVVLKKPNYSLVDTYIPLPAGVLFSPRIGTPMFGLGLLEAIPKEDILAREDIEDRDNDGISGKANYVYDIVSGESKLGRFGWKANTATVLVQCAEAFVNDMGVTNYLYPIEPSFGQNNGGNIVSDKPEIEDEVLDDVVFYSKTLAVPSSRNHTSESVRKGALLFEQLECSKCHVPKQRTGYSPIKALAYQTIYPYTDLLLHDMGENLADNRPDYLADGREWKTRPLWGIGYQLVVNGHTQFLHDGRANNLEEAILWHGGEALTAKDNYKSLSKKERNNLLDFLNSL